jgi:hypothetical protein
MKTFVDMNKITGKNETLDVAVIKGGYIRTYGGMVAIGYKKEKGSVCELAVQKEALKKFLLEEEKPMQAEGDNTGLKGIKHYPEHAYVLQASVNIAPELNDRRQVIEEELQKKLEDWLKIINSRYGIGEHS